jgi:hypothetical protein
VTDAQLVQGAATEVMDWTAEIAKRDGTYDMAGLPLPLLGIDPKLRWTALWGSKSQHEEHTDATWNPLASDADAFMLIDKLDPTDCTLEKSGALWTVTLDGWATASDPDRRRAIVMASLARVEVRP